MDNRDNPVLKPDAINVFTIIPCPLRPRFNRAFSEFIERFNAVQDVPIHCPSLDGLDHDEIESFLAEATALQQLPQLIVSTGMHGLFCRPFRERFLETGHYVATPPPDLAGCSLPEPLRDSRERFGFGWIAVGGWALVCDLSVDPDPELPRVWSDLANPRYADSIVLHGCDGSPGCTALLDVIRREQGEAALTQFAANVTEVRHFSQIIKALDSGNRDRPLFAILPGAAAAQIPSTKRVAIVETTDGPLLSGIHALSSVAAAEQAAKVLPFFSGAQFRDILAVGAFRMVDTLSPDERFVIPDLTRAAALGNAAYAAELVSRFHAGAIPHASCSMEMVST